MRALAWTFAIAAGLGAVVLGAGLYLARVLRGSALVVDYSPDVHDLQVVAMDGATVTLRATARKPRFRPNEPGTWGLESTRGYDQVGRIIEERGGEVVREFLPVQGVTQAGDLVRLDSFAHPEDPRLAHGIHFEEVSIPSALGEFPAWLLPGKSDMWAILVHGKGANRRETLRILPTLHAAGLPCLPITYRNDEDCPPDPTGYYAYGRTEWEDLDAAASYALGHGARRLLIVGYSMGGAITMSFMERSALAKRVAGLILDAPMLNLEETVAHGAGQMGVPRRFLGVSNRIATSRYGLQWGELDYTSRTAHLQAPILLFHGEEDALIPVSLSDSFAEALPELVTYVRVPKAGHVQSWNLDQDGYEAAVRAFVERVESGRQ